MRIDSDFSFMKGVESLAEEEAVLMSEMENIDTDNTGQLMLMQQKLNKFQGRVMFFSNVEKKMHDTNKSVLQNM